MVQRRGGLPARREPGWAPEPGGTRHQQTVARLRLAGAALARLDEPTRG